MSVLLALTSLWLAANIIVHFLTFAGIAPPGFGRQEIGPALVGLGIVISWLIALAGTHKRIVVEAGTRRAIYLRAFGILGLLLLYAVFTGIYSVVMAGQRAQPVYLARIVTAFAMCFSWMPVVLLFEAVLVAGATGKETTRTCQPDDAPAAASSEIPPEVRKTILHAMHNGAHLHAISLYREATGVTVEQARAAVEQMREEK